MTITLPPEALFLFADLGWAVATALCVCDICVDDRSTPRGIVFGAVSALCAWAMIALWGAQ